MRSIIILFYKQIMRRNNSYSLQRINPNANKNNIQSRISNSPKNRLDFPKVGDSGFYGGVGRKHYQKNTDFIHKLILNGGTQTSRTEMPRSKSENYLKLPNQNIQNQQYNKLSKKQNNKTKMDSLQKLEQQFMKKMITQSSPQKIVFNSEIPLRKSSLDGTYGLTHNFNIFTPLDKYYKQIHNPGQPKIQNIQRRFNPTFISSNLGYV